MGIEYRLQPRAYSVHADGESPSTAVADLAASVMDRDPVDLPPLHEVVDTDALNAFVRGRGTGDGSSRAKVEFEYVGCTLTVFDDGEILLVPATESDTRTRGNAEG